MTHGRQQGAAGDGVSLDRRIRTQRASVEGRRKVWKWQCGEKEDTHQLFGPKGIQGVGKRKKHPLDGLLGKQWPQGRTRFHSQQEDVKEWLERRVCTCGEGKRVNAKEHRSVRAWGRGK